MMDASELLRRNFEVFVELNAATRAGLIAELYTEDCIWIHPGGRVRGRAGVNDGATEIRKHFASFRYTIVGEIQSMHQVATCRWGSGIPGEPFQYTGTDFLEEKDGRIAALYTFIDPGPTNP